MIEERYRTIKNLSDIWHKTKMRYRRKRYSAKENFSSCGRSKLGLSLKKQSVFRRSRLCRSRGNVVRVYIVRDAVGVSYTIIIKGYYYLTLTLGFSVVFSVGLSSFLLFAFFSSSWTPQPVLRGQTCTLKNNFWEKLFVKIKKNVLVVYLKE